MDDDYNSPEEKLWQSRLNDIMKDREKSAELNKGHFSHWENVNLGKSFMWAYLTRMVIHTKKMYNIHFLQVYFGIIFFKNHKILKTIVKNSCIHFTEVWNYGNV